MEKSKREEFLGLFSVSNVFYTTMQPIGEVFRIQVDCKTREPAAETSRRRAGSRAAGTKQWACNMRLRPILVFYLLGILATGNALNDRYGSVASLLFDTAGKKGLRGKGKGFELLSSQIATQTVIAGRTGKYEAGILQSRSLCEDRKPHPLLNCEHYKRFRKCNSLLLRKGDFCAKTCGRCVETPVEYTQIEIELERCDDVPPDSRYSCEEQKQFGKCDADFMLEGNYCAQTCGRYPCIENKTTIDVVLPKRTGDGKTRPPRPRPVHERPPSFQGGQGKIPLHASGCPTVAKGVSGSTILKTLSAALEAADLVSQLDDVDLVSTVFAPTNEAFDEFLDALGMTPDELLSEENRDILTEILKLHVVPDRSIPTNGFMDRARLPTLSKTSLLVRRNAEGTMIVSPLGTPSFIVHGDLEACKSVVHVVDEVLVPGPTILSSLGLEPDLISEISADILEE